MHDLSISPLARGLSVCIEASESSFGRGPEDDRERIAATPAILSRSKGALFNMEDSPLRPRERAPAPPPSP